MENVGQTALAAVLTVLVESHLLSEGQKITTRQRSLAETYEDTSTALGRGALTTETLDLAVGLHLIVLQDGHLDLLALVLDLLGGLYNIS